eukprot:scaffold30.g4459.t1
MAACALSCTRPSWNTRSAAPEPLPTALHALSSSWAARRGGCAAPRRRREAAPAYAARTLVWHVHASSSSSSAGDVVERALLEGGLTQQEVQQLQAGAPEAYAALQHDPEGPVLARLLAGVQRARDGVREFGFPVVPLPEVCRRLVNLPVNGGLTAAELAPLLKTRRQGHSLPRVLEAPVEVASATIEVLRQRLPNLWCQLGRALQCADTLLNKDIGARLDALEAMTLLDRLSYMEGLLQGDRSVVIRACNQAPAFLRVSRDLLERNNQYCLSLGMSAAEVAELARDKPTAFIRDITDPYRQELIRLFGRLFGETPREFMQKHPTYAIHDLSRIECRVAFLEKVGHTSARSTGCICMESILVQHFLFARGQLPTLYSTLLQHVLRHAQALRAQQELDDVAGSRRRRRLPRDDRRILKFFARSEALMESIDGGLFAPDRPTRCLLLLGASAARPREVYELVFPPASPATPQAAADAAVAGVPERRRRGDEGAPDALRSVEERGAALSRLAIRSLVVGSMDAPEGTAAQRSCKVFLLVSGSADRPPPPEFATRPTFRLGMRRGVHVTVLLGEAGADAALQAEGGDGDAIGQAAPCPQRQEQHPAEEQHPTEVWWQSRHVLQGLHSGQDGAG